MSYKVLTQDEMDDYIVSSLAIQEQDRYCHEINIQRFTAILKALPPIPTLKSSGKDPYGELRKKYTLSLNETKARLYEVNIIMAAVEAQLPVDTRLSAAIKRFKDSQAKAKEK